MQLKTINTLRDSSYRVRFETTPSDAEVELISDFGEPTISVGGNFYGDTVAFVAAPSIGATITQGGAVGVYIYSGVMRRTTVADFTAGVAGAYTITSVTDVSYTLSSNTKAISSDFPVTNSFDDEVSARIYSSTVESRMINAVVTLRAQEDTFSDEVVKTI